MIEPELGREEPTPVNLGVRLREAREARQLSREELSLKVNIPVKYLIALESMDLNRLPAAPFIKGYIRAYAKAVDLPGDEMVAEFTASLGKTLEPEITTINKVGRQVKVSDPLMRLSVFIFLLAIIGACVWWWQTQSGDGFLNSFKQKPQVAAEQPAATASAADPTDIQARLQAKKEEMANMEQQLSALSEDQPQSGDQAAASDSAPAEEPQYLSDEQVQSMAAAMEKSSPASDAAAETTTAAPAEPAAETSPANDASPAINATAELQLTFSGDCWVSIRDANDKLVFANTKHAGETLKLSLEAPASLLVGKVSSVSDAQFAGEALDLQSHARKDVAKLTLSK